MVVSLGFSCHRVLYILSAPFPIDFLPDEATALAIAGDSIVAETPVAPAVAASAAQSRDSITTSVPTVRLTCFAYWQGELYPEVLSYFIK